MLDGKKFWHSNYWMAETKRYNVTFWQAHIPQALLCYFCVGQVRFDVQKQYDPRPEPCEYCADKGISPIPVTELINA